MITPLSITESNLSVAWAKTFLALMEPGKSERHPATITINNLHEGAALEVDTIRQRLDKELVAHDESRCGTVAGTLFPRSMWNSHIESDAQKLFERYERAWPKIAKCAANNRGVYFRRLTSYAPSNYTGKPINQLEFIQETFAGGNHRKSALQASILDPTRDHTNNRQKGFPCLQQVAFTPLGKSQLSITGFYATQYHFEKAYGNYMGLYWLGQFMAHQLKLRLTTVVCMAATLKLGGSAKSSLECLENDMKAIVAPNAADGDT
jgi:hypothetical protein